MGGTDWLALPFPRHCERSEAIHTVVPARLWIASSQELLAMTAEGMRACARNDG
jgi:hypothetical protein